MAIWQARSDIVDRGYKPETQRLLDLTAPPTPDQIAYLQRECTRLQDEMLAFVGSQMAPAFTGLVSGLIEVYRRDPDSPYQAIRHSSRTTYDDSLDLIERTVGARALPALGARDFKRWYASWRYPEGIDGPDHAYGAYAAISMVRRLLGFGIAMEIENVEPGEISHCIRLKTIIAELEFQNGEPRTEQITAQQAIALRAEAHRQGYHSVALAQALQFDLNLRQKDCIGEWVPMSEPGLSTVTHRGEKWLYGLRWEEVDENLILRHQMSKARKKKILEFDLKLYPMVMEELAYIPLEQRYGPMVKNDRTGLPWGDNGFRVRWRALADAIGIPRTVKNMDSRAGATTETIAATGGNLEAARKQAGHSDVKTTQRYSRGLLASNSDTAVLRMAKREKDSQ